jgi:ribosomal peptide maturation radical SAM protein 1
MQLVQLRTRAPRPAGRRRKTLLVDLPFKTVTRPNIGLSLLRASLAEAGFECEIRYANLEFAARIGEGAYQTIAEEIPEPLLVGDLVFAPAVDPRAGQVETLRERGPLFLKDGSPLGEAPEWVWSGLPLLQREAAAFAAELAQEIARMDHDVVGFSCMFQTLPALAVAKALKALAPDKHVVFGGSHCEGDMGLALHESYPWIDFVVRGEGERPLVDLVTALSEGDSGALAATSGLVWRDGGRSRAAGERSVVVQDLDRLPRPDYSDWFEQLGRALPELSKEDIELPIETSRGCWYGEKHHCTFCGLNGQSMAFRSKRPETVLEELRSLSRHGVPFVYAVDLILDHRYFATLLPALAREDHGRTLFFETKSNLTRRQVELLRDAGIRLIQPGIESLSTPVLELMEKGVSGYQNLRLLKWAVEMGIGVFWTLLYGFPGERAEDYASLAALLPSLTHLIPPQGGYEVRIDRFSPLFRDAAALGAGATRPAPAYGVVHALPEDTVRRLAYHFEAAGGARSRDYMEPVAAALRQWHEGFGRASFVSLDRGGALRLYDRRPGAARPQARLEGLARAAYLACDAGATAAAVAAELGEPEPRVRKILRRFVDERWAAAIDGRFVSLAVPLDGAVPDLPESVLPAVCHAVYCKHVRSLGRFVPRERPVPGLPRKEAA